MCDLVDDAIVDGGAVNPLEQHVEGFDLGILGADRGDGRAAAAHHLGEPRPEPRHLSLSPPRSSSTAGRGH